MPKVATAHYNSKKQPALNHNDRTNDNAKTITKKLTHLNEYFCTSNEVRKNIEKLYKKAYENFYKYCENKNGLAKSRKPKGLQNFTKKAITSLYMKSAKMLQWSNAKSSHKKSQSLQDLHLCKS